MWPVWTAVAFVLATGWPTGAMADLRVVATTPDLAALATAVGGEHADVTSLALPTQDPHFVDARPNLALALARADLLIAVGLSLEVGWLPTLQTGSRNGAIQTGARGYLDASTLVPLLEVPRGRVDRSMGDVHPGGNPHFMRDPRRAVQVARGIAARMAQLDADNAAHYRGNAEAFVRQLDAARARWEAALGALRGAKVIAYHRSMAYLADWLGFEVVEHVEPRPGIPPNPRQVATVLTAARAQGARAIVQESYFPTSTSRLLAERSGTPLVVLTAGPDVRGGQSYLDWMGAVVRQLGAAARR
jgi:zinc/manganese transport system substrate-binding protein